MRILKCRQCGTFPKWILKHAKGEIFALGRPECLPCIVMGKTEVEAKVAWNLAHSKESDK